MRRWSWQSILLRHAGGGRNGAFLDLALEDWRYTLDLGVTAPFVLGQRAARHMAEHGGGAIVNISSVHSAHVWANDTPYGVAKAGLNRLTQSMATELAHLGIRTNCIAPGYINVSETDEEQARYDAGDGRALERRTDCEMFTPIDRCLMPIVFRLGGPFGSPQTPSSAVW